MFASAGHPPPLLRRCRSGECERLDAEGLILGVRREFPYALEVRHFEPGDLLLLYTDGITEAANAEDELFGEERLVELLRHSPQCSPDELIERIFQEVRLFTGSHNFNDDVSLVVMQVESCDNIV
jgi:serine phosphatase RsbU (regulator of sigma subunit)